MIVLDASAAVDWLLQTSAGQSIEKRIYSRNETLHAPHLLDLEVTQVLRRLALQGAVSAHRANGAVRDLPAVEAMGFQLYARRTSVSHAYAHIFEYGSQVKVGGLEVHPGDLLHGDRHGILTVPKEIAPEIPAAAARLQKTERKVIEFCRSPEFSVDKVRQLLKGLNQGDSD